MRRLLWLAAIAIGVAFVRRQSARRADRRAQDLAAQANWENEGGAPVPAEA
jgi:hypothetical protein